MPVITKITTQPAKYTDEISMIAETQTVMNNFTHPR